jgi:hypothetical protein
MKRVVCSLALACLLATVTHASEEFFDRLSDSLVFSTADGTLRARVSGTFDLEAYRVQAPAPGLIYTSSENLFNPRLTLFLDAQAGDRVYFFAQARADRGFDPANRHARGRLDEYAVRIAPWDRVKFNIQAGKFATVVGNWVPRHGSWENPFVTAPLAYEHLTGIWDSAAARNSGTLLGWAHMGTGSSAEEEYADKHLRSPIIWGPAYSSGIAMFAEAGKFSGALEVKNAALPISPKGWDASRRSFERPTVSTRVTWQPNVMWRLGVSASTGPFLLPSATPSLAPGHSLGDYRQVLTSQEISFAWHHWQVWAELFQARFEIPNVGDAEVMSGYAEVKYRFSPMFAGALRWNFQNPGTIPHGANGRVQWGRDVQRVDFAPTWRFSANSQFKLQLSLQHEPGAPRKNSRIIAAQLTVRF